MPASGASCIGEGGRRSVGVGSGSVARGARARASSPTSARTYLLALISVMDSLTFCTSSDVCRPSATASSLIIRRIFCVASPSSGGRVVVVSGSITPSPRSELHGVGLARSCGPSCMDPHASLPRSCLHGSLGRSDLGRPAQLVSTGRVDPWSPPRRFRWFFALVSFILLHSVGDVTEIVRYIVEFRESWSVGRVRE